MWRALVLILAACGCATKPVSTATVRSSEERAVRFLEREVPAWSRENKCFSCHNNGDGARALFSALGSGYSFERDALGETTQWLEKPAKWHENKGDPGFSDQRLANLQFALALLSAIESGQS